MVVTAPPKPPSRHASKRPDTVPARVTSAAADCHHNCGQSIADEGAIEMAACLRRLRQRDEAAARWFMDQLYPMVLKIVRAHLPRRIGEEDLVQMVFVKVFTNLERYAGRAPVEHWVSRIAVNTCLNELKAERCRPECRWSDLTEEQQHLLDTLGSTGEASTVLHSLAARDLLDKLMASLSPQDRLVVQLLHLEERSAAEIRRMTGWSIPVIKVRAFRARKKLQKSLQRLADQEEL